MNLLAALGLALIVECIKSVSQPSFPQSTVPSCIVAAGEAQCSMIAEMRSNPAWRYVSLLPSFRSSRMLESRRRPVAAIVPAEASYGHGKGASKSLPISGAGVLDRSFRRQRGDSSLTPLTRPHPTPYTHGRLIYGSRKPHHAECDGHLRPLTSEARPIQANETETHQRA